MRHLVSNGFACKLRILPQTALCFAAVLLFGITPAMLLTAAAALLHECGHLLAIRYAGGQVRSITVYPFGVEISAPGQFSYYDDLRIGLAGAFTNLILAVLSGAIVWISRFRLHPRLADAIYYFSWANLTLGALNLCPIRFLDGGAALRCILLLCLPADRAEKLSAQISDLTLFFLWIAAVYLLLIDAGSLSLFLFCMFLFLHRKKDA